MRSDRNGYRQQAKSTGSDRPAGLASLIDFPARALVAYAEVTRLRIETEYLIITDRFA